MAVHDLYFKRQKQLRGEYTEVYQYDQIPRTLKNQIVFIWKEVVGVDTWYARTQEEGQKSRFYKQIVNTPFLTQHHRRIIKPPACTQQVSYH